MSRPTQLLKGNTLYWVIRLYDSDGALVDADSDPTINVYKNGVDTSDSVTVAKRAATTGIYDCSYDPASEVEGDQFSIEESATISSTTYEFSWECVVLDPMADIKGSGWESGTDTLEELYDQFTSMTTELDAIKGDTFNTNTDSLEQIRDAIDDVDDNFDSIVILSAPVATTGQITAPIIIGDDYLASRDRAFEWTIDAITGVSVGTATCKFGAAHPKKGSFIVDGTVSDNGDGTWKLSFDVTRSDTAELEEGEYEWSVEVRDSSSNEMTQVRNDGDCYKVKLLEKQT